jgi:oligopeptide/dipeptide ABC transporter ATP-binding protein
MVSGTSWIRKAADIIENRQGMDTDSTVLKIKDLKIDFDTFEGRAQVLDGISFGLGQGDTLGLVGETGCGKSITAKAILGLLPVPPTRIVSGEIVFHSEDLLRLSERQMEKIRGNKIAMIFQDPMTYLNPVFSIEKQMVDVILGHARHKEEPMTRKEARKKAIFLLDAVRIPNPPLRIKEFPHEFSGGMRQRVLIAMALAGDPDILIADEPTTALDVTIQAQILRLLRDVVERFQHSVLVISHDLGVVATVCQRIAVMYAGNIIESTTIDKIFEKPSHPYTKGLLRSIPTLTRRKEALVGIHGSIPDFIHPPKGCRFHPRCDCAMDICSQVKPVLNDMGDGHWVACFLFESSWPSESLAKKEDSGKP